MNICSTVVATLSVTVFQWQIDECEGHQKKMGKKSLTAHVTSTDGCSNVLVTRDQMFSSRRRCDCD